MSKTPKTLLSNMVFNWLIENEAVKSHIYSISHEFDGIYFYKRDNNEEDYIRYWYYPLCIFNRDETSLQVDAYIWTMYDNNTMSNTWTSVALNAGDPEFFEKLEKYIIPSIKQISTSEMPQQNRRYPW